MYERLLRVFFVLPQQAFFRYQSVLPLIFAAPETEKQEYSFKLFLPHGHAEN